MAKQELDKKTPDLLPADIAPVPASHGRKTLGDRAMTSAERQKLRRDALKLRNAPTQTDQELKKMDLWLPDDMAQAFISKSKALRISPSDLLATLLAFADWSQIEENQIAVEQHQKDMLSVPVSELVLSKFVRNRLFEFDVQTVGDIVALGERGLLKLPSFGRKSCNEVMQALACICVTLPE